MINVGGSKVKKIYFGTTEVSKAFLGDVQVYPNSSLALSASSLSFDAAGSSASLTITVEEDQAWSLTLPSGFTASATSGTGTTTITITASNNTSTSAVSGTLVVTSEDLTESCSLSQAAGSQVYGAVTVSISYGSNISAAGGSVSPTISYSQTWTWNGVSGSGGTITSGGSISYSASGLISGASISSSTGAVTAESLGTTVKSATTVCTVTATVTLNGVTGTATATVTQAANEVTGTSDAVSYGTPTVTLSYSTTIAAGGGTSSPTISYTQVKTTTTTTTYTSGSTSSSSSTSNITSGASITYSASGLVSGASIVSSTGVVTAASLGTTVQSASTVCTVTASVVLNGQTGTGTATVTQAANSATYGTLTVNFSYGSIGYSGGTLSPSVSASEPVTYTSGATQTLTTYHDAVFSLSSSVSWATINSSTGVLTIDSNSGDERSGEVSLDFTMDTSGTKAGGVRATFTQNAHSLPNYTLTLSIGRWTGTMYEISVCADKTMIENVSMTIEYQYGDGQGAEVTLTLGPNSSAGGMCDSIGVGYSDLVCARIESVELSGLHTTDQPACSTVACYTWNDWVYV